MTYFDSFFFVAFPYVALTIFLIGSIYRYRSAPFTYSSLSSQFLEGRRLFWGSVPFHWGILVVGLGHLLAFLFPKTTLAWNSVPVRLIILEVSAFVFGLAVLAGLLQLFVRRMSNARVRAVTSRADVVVEVLLIAQVFLGCWIAVGYRWGSSWFASDLTPYLRSIFTFDPQIAAVSAMPLVIKLHVIGAFLILLLIPFTRLAHLLVVPLHYLVRPYQRVLWNWDRRRVRDPKTAWSKARPKNN